MKVLHINSYFNGSLFYKNLYDKQVNEGLDIDVFVPVSQYYKSPSVDLGRYTRVSINHGKYDRLIFHLKHNKIYKDIVKQYKINDYSIIHAHSLFSNGYIAMKLKQNYGVPYIAAVRNTDVNTFFKYMVHLRKIGVHILQEADKVIFLSKSYRDTVIGKYVHANLKEEIYSKTIIIPNGIDDFWFKNLGNTRKAPNKENLKLLYVGVVDKNKNIITTVKAIEILQERGYNIEFTVVGRIEDKGIYGQIKDLPFINYVYPKPKEKLLDIYRNNHIFVMPSIHESFGLVYSEAMSQGLPVIYSKGQGFDGQFEDGEVGYGVNCMDENEIASKIINIVSKYKEKSKKCISLCEKFLWNTITDLYTSIYKEVSL